MLTGALRQHRLLRPVDNIHRQADTLPIVTLLPRRHRLGPLLAALALTLLAACGSPEPLGPAVPYQRTSALSAYDPHTGMVVLFGGQGGSLPGQGPSLGDTWTWNAHGWTEHVVATTPPPRAGAAMAYDPLTGTVLLFGGPGLDDTWSWTGATWVRLHPATSPPPGVGLMAYDSASRRITLVAACCTDPTYAGPVTPRFQTWTWDGRTWTLAGGAPPYLGGLLADDPATRSVVLIEGGGATPGTTATWTWDGHDWRATTPSTSPSFAGPGVTTTAQLAYDPLSRAMLLVEDGTDSNVDRATWRWDGTTWTRLTTTTGPPASAAMVTDGALGRVVLFGGPSRARPFDAAWTWDGSGWQTR